MRIIILFLVHVVVILPSYINGQDICDEDKVLIANSMKFHIAIEVESENVKYVDGKTCDQVLDLRNTTEGFGGTTWELVEYPSTPGVFAIKSLGTGCDTKWLDGQTCIETITLRNENYSTNSGLGGTRWVLHYKGEGKYAFEALGSCDTRWLALVNNQFILVENPEMNGSDWMIDNFSKKTVFESGQDGYHTFRIPSLITTNEGTLIAFCEGRVNSGSDSGDIDMVMKKSTDNGLTWSPLQVIWNDGNNTCGNPTVVVDNNNRIWLFLTHNKGSDNVHEIRDLSGDGGRSIWYMYSDNEGASWSNPKDITPFVQLPGTRWDATGPGIGIQKRDGSIIIPGNNRMISSFDFGETWCRSPEKLGSGETQIVELDDESIMRNRRSGSDDNYRLINISNDNGITWGIEYLDDELPSPSCQGSILRFSFEEEGVSRILFSNPADTTFRNSLTTRISYDNGNSWVNSKKIWNKYSSYSCLTKLCNETIGVLFEEGDAVNLPPGSGDFKRITFQNFTLNWLTDWNDPESFPTSISKISNKQIDISIFPNPAQNAINIEIPKIQGKIEFELVNTIGQTIDIVNSLNSGNNYMINISNLNQGIYFLIVKIDGQLIGKKIVKK